MDKIELRVQGKRAKLMIKGNKGNTELGDERVKRGKVGVFSNSSRKRMSELIATLGEAIPVFVTLTYGREFPKDGETWKRHLGVFFKRLKRKYPHLSAVWKLEPQKRLAPHFHLLVYGGRIDKEWLAVAWAECSEDTTIDHILAGTRIESVRSSRGAAYYCSKYLCKLVSDKLPDYWHKAGRWWGIHNRKKLPLAEEKSYYMEATVGALFLDFLSSRLLESKKQAFIRKHFEDSSVHLRVHKEVFLDKWDKPTSTYADNIFELLNDFKMYSSSKATLHCITKCRGSIKRATAMCEKVMDSIQKFITGTGISFSYS